MYLQARRIRKRPVSSRFDGMQDHVFDVIGRDAVLNALQGFNSTIFAYGQVRPMHYCLQHSCAMEKCPY